MSDTTIDKEGIAWESPSYPQSLDRIKRVGGNVWESPSNPQSLGRIKRANGKVKIRYLGLTAKKLHEISVGNNRMPRGMR